MKIAISEVFYSLQGEGVFTGVPAVFLRLAGCNLMCGGQGTQFDKQLHNNATWRCDTVEVWMKGKSVNFEDVFNAECLHALKNGAHLVVTGGEPLMHEQVLLSFFHYIHNNISQQIFVEMETNGTITPTREICAWVDLFNVSPKLSNSGNSLSARFNETAITLLNTLNVMQDDVESVFKFVISSNEDWLEIVRDFLPIIDKNRIILMPAGENQALLKQTKQLVAKLAKEHVVKFSTRLHIELWDKKTGV